MRLRASVQPSAKMDLLRTGTCAGWDQRRMGAVPQQIDLSMGENEMGALYITHRKALGV